MSIKHLQDAEKAARDASDARTSQLVTITLVEQGFAVRGRINFDGDVYQAVHLLSWVEFHHRPHLLSDAVKIVVRKLDGLAAVKGGTNVQG